MTTHSFWDNFTDEKSLSIITSTIKYAIPFSFLSFVPYFVSLGVGSRVPAFMDAQNIFLLLASLNLTLPVFFSLYRFVMSLYFHHCNFHGKHFSYYAYKLRTRIAITLATLSTLVLVIVLCTSEDGLSAVKTDNASSSSSQSVSSLPTSTSSGFPVSSSFPQPTGNFGPANSNNLSAPQGLASPPTAPKKNSTAAELKQKLDNLTPVEVGLVVNQSFLMSILLFAIFFTVAKWYILQFQLSFFKKTYLCRVRSCAIIEQLVVKVNQLEAPDAVLTCKHGSNMFAYNVRPLPYALKDLTKSTLSLEKFARLIQFLKKKNKHHILRGDQFFTDKIHSKQAGEWTNMALKDLGRRTFIALLQKSAGHMKKHNQRELTFQDFQECLPFPLSQECFHLFDKNNDGSVSQFEFETILTETLKEREALSTSLTEGKNTFNSLATFINVLALLGGIVSISLLVVQQKAQVFTTIATCITASAVAFGNTMKAFIESLVFVFSTHPYDIGDKIVINDVTYTVHKLHILT
jgi:small-conductance mechanosensitive channel